MSLLEPVVNEVILTAREQRQQHDDRQLQDWTVDARELVRLLAQYEIHHPKGAPCLRLPLRQAEKAIGQFDRTRLAS